MKKMKFHHMLTSLIMALSLVLCSCGYVSDAPPINIDVYRPDELQACKIDINKLGEIFKADQKEQIRCLQENFIQFTKYVRAKENGSISEVELNAFVRKFFQGQSDSIVKGLSLIFQLNMLLLKDEASKISRNNITPLFELLVNVNRDAIVITQVLKDMNDETKKGSFWELRAKFISATNRFSNDTIAIIKDSTGMPKELNMREFILDASRKLGTKELNAETVDSLIFLKRILVGGEKEIITSAELKLLIENLPKITTLCFDLFYVRDNNFNTDEEFALFYLQSIKDLYEIIKFGQKDFQLVTIDQLLKLANNNFAPERDFSKFKPSIIALKSRLIGGEKESFSLRDLRVILDMTKDFITRNYFNVVTYELRKKVLEENKNIPSLDFIDFKEYKMLSNLDKSEFHQDFVDTAQNIRYFRSGFEKEKATIIPFYSNDFIRNKKGFIEATRLKWLAGKLIKAYGHKTNGIGQVNLQEFETFLFDMQPILEAFDLWSPNPKTFARNAILLADLFQNKSNGDLEVNVIEATEYMQMILSAVEITDKLSNQLSLSCDFGINREDPVFAVDCFNKYFFDSLLYKLDLKAHFPRLNNYVLSVHSAESEDFLAGVEGFARDNPDPKLPIGNRDSILVIGALLNIESTFLRFDLNRDNLIDYRELMEAFKVYRKAIISIAELKPKDEGYASSIFLYMVSKMEIPQTGSWVKDAKFLGYHSCVGSAWCRDTFMDKIEAKRLNVGKLLYYLVNQPGTAGKDKKR